MSAQSPTLDTLIRDIAAEARRLDLYARGVQVRAHDDGTFSARLAADIVRTSGTTADALIGLLEHLRECTSATEATMSDRDVRRARALGRAQTRFVQTKPAATVAASQEMADLLSEDPDAR